MVKVTIVVLALFIPTVGLAAADLVGQASSSTTTSSTKPATRSTRGRSSKKTSAKPPAHPATPPATDPAPANSAAATPTSSPASAAPSTPPPATPPVATASPAVTQEKRGGDNWLVLIAGVLVAIGGLQWWAVRKMRDGLTQTKDAAEAAATSAAAAARALAASERAYLVARNWAMRAPAVGEVPEVDFVVENVGRTPARRTLVRGQIEVRDTPLPDRPAWRTSETTGGTLTIAPGGRPSSTLAGDQPLTYEDLDRLRSGAAFLSIAGRVDYEDVLGNAQSVSFAWRFDVTTGTLTYDTASDKYHEAT